MKKILIIVLVSTLLTSCADNKVIGDKEYRPYGLINENDCKNDSIQYEVSYAAVISGVVFSEMLFIPTIYTFGFNLYEPVCKKSEYNTKNKGVVN
jgi:hypothetical protein